MQIIGREQETALLNEYIASPRPEFIAIYGRRRIGKTYMIDQQFGKTMAFAASGVIDGTRNEQMAVFCHALRQYGYHFNTPKPSNWLEAFFCLEELLDSRANGKPQIVFLDELPCFDTHGSRFIAALDHFWNSWASTRPHVKLIVCGSATSWMIKNIVDNHGGMHNRITHEMHLEEFTLHEVEMYLHAAGINWNRFTITQLYMVTGGVPYYLSLLRSDESLAQNIDRMFFAPNAPLRNEFERIYKALFNDAQTYIDITRLLSTRREGLTRDDICTTLHLPSSGFVTQALTNLVACDIVRFYYGRGKRGLAKQGTYQIADFFTLFYLTFMAGRTTDDQFWQKSINTPAINTWQGLAFERVCMAHIRQIKKALHLDTIRTEHYAWYSRKAEQRVQIDLIIERADGIANLCEMKFAPRPYAMTQHDEERLLAREAVFLDETALRIGVHTTMIAPYGISPNAHSCNVQAVLKMDDLFET